MPRFRLRSSNKSNKPRRLLSGIHPIPTMVTLGNLICGFFAIVFAMRADNAARGQFQNYTSDDCFYWSAILIFAAMIFDVMDGKVARLTKSASKFGMEMDSLCDVVSFGVAPAVLVKAMIDFQAGAGHPVLADIYTMPMLAVYISCAAIRLARYNIESETGHRDFFFGMPSPGAAGCVASLAIFIIPGNRLKLSDAGTALEHGVAQVNHLRNGLFSPMLQALPLVMLILGMLMISRVHYPHVGDRFLRGRKSFMHIMVLGLALVFIVMHHEILLAVAFNGYMLLGLINEVRYQIFPQQRPEEWVKAVAAAAATPVPAGPGVSGTPDSPTQPKEPPTA